jgi:endogenous inhibitor of DNA gyrase (YacG/DUF329 family)
MLALQSDISECQLPVASYRLGFASVKKCLRIDLGTWQSSASGYDTRPERGSADLWLGFPGKVDQGKPSYE